ncbi:uncharacterized protein Nmag_1892 [Natrialba magadii ATCC 43099]|uniref:Uncharacterized protein n=1 Tax=Natrialba magadii (strain ATCC 43099 / DSM 3394 / CCM 3739 / CIP 104546 / IAM 13178 / JCM 8861 / NBRC 102185 / NCIMB 2190 / MS3) TaxID=547559 RepID=D3SV56_NATMM|nr:hypothetical protein [Natrialba magadii]ADD05464.1 uncharacterized protein Nmag_1892 [Natrialba magadii ATCC 43099]
MEVAEGETNKLNLSTQSITAAATGELNRPVEMKATPVVELVNHGVVTVKAAKILDE